MNILIQWLNNVRTSTQKVHASTVTAPAEAPADPKIPRDSFSGGGQRNAVQVASRESDGAVQAKMFMRGTLSSLGGFAVSTGGAWVATGGGGIGLKVLGGIALGGGAAVAACGLLLLLATFLAPPKIKRLVANKLGLDKG
jgi:hypothetical protein